MEKAARVGRSAGARSPFPRLELFAEPTPLLPLRNLSALLGPGQNVCIWAKREDLIPLGLGGNKLRNMEFLLAEARKLAAHRVIVYGRPGANHCRLAAAAAASVSLPATVVLAGRRPTSPPATERLTALMGATILYTEDERPASAAALAAQEADRLVTEGLRPYLMPPGASGLLGACGHVLAGIELAEQAPELGVQLDYVFVGVATGGTLAGVRVGLALAGCPAIVVGVPTHLALAPSPEDLVTGLHTLSQALIDAWGPDTVPAVERPLGDIVLDRVAWNTYGETTTAGWAAQVRVAATEGLLLDPIYTCHVAAALLRWAERGELDGKSAVLWVGGGTPSLFAR